MTPQLLPAAEQAGPHGSLPHSIAPGDVRHRFRKPIAPQENATLPLRQGAEKAVYRFLQLRRLQGLEGVFR